MNMTDYESAYRSFRLHVPGDYEFTRDVVEHWAAQHPGKLALVAVDPRGEARREISFGDLARASRKVANALEALGVNAGERAFVMLPRIPEWYELLLGMFRRRRRADARHHALHARATSPSASSAPRPRWPSSTTRPRPSSPRCATSARRCGT